MSDLRLQLQFRHRTPPFQPRSIEHFRLQEQSRLIRSHCSREDGNERHSLQDADHPVAFVSGDSDGGTPLWFTEHAVPGFQNRVEVVMSNRGHTEWAPCIETLYQRFLNQGSVEELDASACSHLSRPAFKTK